MTDDLVTRLRETQKLYEQAGVDGSEGALQAGRAADRIEELEAKLAKMKSAMTDCMVEIDEYIILHRAVVKSLGLSWQEERRRKIEYAKNPARAALTEIHKEVKGD